MLTIFNRKELLNTLDMNRQAAVRNILSANNIEYIVNVTNLQRSFKNCSYGVNLNFSYEYKIYVHKKDYDRALNLIR